MNQKIELVAAFVGLTFLPQPFVLGSNTINPKLVLHEEEIEYRALFTTNTVRYTELEKVDVFLFGKKTTNLCLSRPNSIFTFVGNLNNKAKLIEVLQFLQTKNCRLTDRAINLVNTG